MTIAEELPFSKEPSIIGDIEDVLGVEGRQTRSDDHKVKIHMRRERKSTRRAQQTPQEETPTDDEQIQEEPHSNDINPSEHKIYLKTWGCSHNTSDSEYMAGLLTQYGFQISTSPAASSVWILNSCTVKGPSEQHFKNQIEQGQKSNKKVIVSGCVPQGAPRSPYIKNLSIIGVKQIDEIVQVVEETLRGNTIRLLSFKKPNAGKNPPGASLNFPKIRKNELIEIIPVSTGCLNNCTYCKTKLARGDLSSYPRDEIVSRAEQVIKNEGVKEIWLTSEDLGAWGIDLGLTIVDLLTELVEVIPQDCMLRLGMTNPPYILDHLEEMSVILNHPQVYGFLHIPLQAASDSVLLEMKREYSKKQFETIVDFLQQRVPHLTIATDIICGFPTETESDFQETLSLLKKYKFPVLYINQFYPRPGTVAAKMPRIPTHIVKTRTKRVTDLFLSYSAYGEDRVGRVYSVLVTEVAHDRVHLVGHNKAYEQVLIKPRGSTSDLMGKKVTVRIVSVSKFSMVGEIVGSSGFNYVFLVAGFVLVVAVLVCVNWVQ